METKSFDRTFTNSGMPRRGRGWLLSVAAAALLATGCGGGGGGGGSLGSYPGTNTPAGITASDGATAASGFLNAMNMNDPVLNGLPFKPGQEVSASADGLHGMGGDGLRGGLGKAGDGAGRAKDTVPCVNTGGTYDVEGVPDAVGTYRETYHNCDQFGGGVVITSGTWTDTTSTWTASADESTLLAYSWRTSADVAATYGGKEYTYREESSFDGDRAKLLDHAQGTVEAWNQTDGTGFRLENARFTDTYADAEGWGYFGDCIKTTDMEARIYVDSATASGYVDARTTTPLRWTVDDCTGAGPSSGGPIVLTGAGSGKVVVTPLSDTQARVEIYEDADATADDTSVRSWSSLGFF